MPEHPKKKKKKITNPAQITFRKRLNNSNTTTLEEEEILRTERQNRKDIANQRLRKAKAEGYLSTTAKKRLAKIEAGRKRFRRIAKKN